MGLNNGRFLNGRHQGRANFDNFVVLPTKLSPQMAAGNNYFITFKCILSTEKNLFG